MKAQAQHVAEKVDPVHVDMVVQENMNWELDPLRLANVLEQLEAALHLTGRP